MLETEYPTASPEDWSMGKMIPQAMTQIRCDLYTDHHLNRHHKGYEHRVFRGPGLATSHSNCPRVSH
jgi:hypothetical protein